MKKRGLKRFYTLIEIMTVIVIAAILFGIGIPAFTTMIQGSNMTIAIRQLSAKISAARAYAVTNRCRVALLLVEKENESKINPDHVCSAYRVCVVTGDETGSAPYSFLEWIEDENWKILPRGIIRNTLSSPAQVKITASDKDELNKMLENIFGKLDNKEITLSALIFLPSGQLKKGAEITLTHGRNLREDSDIKTVPTGGTNHILTINQYSGKVSVKEESGS